MFLKFVCLPACKHSDGFFFKKPPLPPVVVLCADSNASQRAHPSLTPANLGRDPRGFYIDLVISPGHSQKSENAAERDNRNTPEHLSTDAPHAGTLRDGGVRVLPSTLLESPCCRSVVIWVGMAPTMLFI